jgi:hypothetical protein
MDKAFRQTYQDVDLEILKSGEKWLFRRTAGYTAVGVVAELAVFTKIDRVQPHDIPSWAITIGEGLVGLWGLRRAMQSAELGLDLNQYIYEREHPEPPTQLETAEA